jgi:hypothetical protein
MEEQQAVAPPQRSLRRCRVAVRNAEFAADLSKTGATDKAMEWRRGSRSWVFRASIGHFIEERLGREGLATK